MSIYYVQEPVLENLFIGKGADLYNKLVIATPSDLSCRGDTKKAIWSTLPDGEGDDGKGRVFRGEGQVHKADEGSLCKGTKM